jgi:glycerophosphoryl diester phosphodiesterase
MNINYMGAELVFSKDDAEIAQDSYIENMHKKGKILWVNSLVYSSMVPLAGGHNDDISMLGNPEQGWGWLANKGFDIIQTDWTNRCGAYLRSINVRK